MDTSEAAERNEEHGAPAQTAPDLDRAGPYRIVRRLGGGMMADVYLGQSDAGEPVAIKILSREIADDANYRHRFERECELLLAVDHPYVVRILDQGEVGGRLFLVQEYVPGPSIEQVLETTRAPIPEGFALEVAIQVAEALREAAARPGIIHRDVKPANILLRQDLDRSFSVPMLPPVARVKLIDFGLAREHFGQDPNVTQQGICMGTPDYMAPEQVLGDRRLDPHCDQYALGCTLYHMLTGTVPYPAPTPVEAMRAHVGEPVPDPGRLVPSLSPLTRQLVFRAMAKRRGKRHVDYDAFLGLAARALTEVRERQEQSATGKLLRKPLLVQSTRLVRRNAGGTARIARGTARTPTTGLDKHDRKALAQFERDSLQRAVVPHGFRIVSGVAMPADQDELPTASVKPSKPGSHRLRVIAAQHHRDTPPQPQNDFADLQPIIDAENGHPPPAASPTPPAAQRALPPQAQRTASPRRNLLPWIGIGVVVAIVLAIVLASMTGVL